VITPDSKALAVTNNVCFPPDIWSPGADIYLRNTNSPIWPVYTPITWVTSRGLKDLRVPGAVYLPGILAHEFGHVLGLGESQDKNATMYSQDTSITFRKWYQLLLGQVSLAKDDEDGLRYLYSQAPVSGAHYLTFDQGNPVIPGDGVFINFQGGSDTWALVDFELSTPFPLASAPNGFTLTAFFETLPVTPSNLFNVIFGIPGRRECNATVANPEVEILGPIVNGVQGIAIVYSRQELERVVTIISSGSGCTDVTVDDFVLSGFFVFDLTQPDTFAKDLDAAAIGVGQNVFPTSGTPAP
jgi:matrixin